MSTFAVLLLCVQACLVQTVFGQYGCGCGIAPAPIAVAPSIPSCGALSYSGSYPASYSASYGGVGEGNVAVAGELPVAGTTAVAGQIPILGAVTFTGTVPAAGAVSIVGNCACGCGY